MSVQKVPQDAVPLISEAPYAHEQHLLNFNHIGLAKTDLTYVINLRFQERILDIPRRVQESKHKGHEFDFTGEFEFVRGGAIVCISSVKGEEHRCLWHTG